MNREEELKQIKKESAEIEKYMNDMFDLAFMLNNRNDIMNPQAHYEKLSRMVTHYMGSIQQSYGYMSIKVIEALEQECILDKIKSDLYKLYNDRPSDYNHSQRTELFYEVIKILDKYRKEQ